MHGEILGESGGTKDNANVELLSQPGLPRLTSEQTAS